MASDLIDINNVTPDLAPTITATGFGWNRLDLSPHSIDLYADGCLVYGLPNCTYACADPSMAWDRFWTLMNCLMYPTISGLMAAGRLTPNGMRMADYYGILPSRSVDLSVMQAAIDDCAKAYCKSRTDTPLAVCSRSYMAPTDHAPTALDYVNASVSQRRPC